MSDIVRDRFDEHPYGWVIVAVSTVCLALGFGAGGTISVFIKPFEQEFGWLRADTSMAYTMHTIGAAFGGLVWGSLSDRIGARNIGLVGAIGMAAGLAALRWQNDLWVLYLLYFLSGAVGFACLFTPVLALTGLWFNARKGLAIGIVTAGGAIGQGIVPYLAQLMITGLGWRDAALWLGAGYFVVLFPLMFLLRSAPSAGQAHKGADRSDSNLWGVPHAITIPWLSLAGFFCCICMAVPLVHLVPLGIDLGCSPQTAASMLLSLMIAGVFRPSVLRMACRSHRWPVGLFHRIAGADFGGVLVHPDQRPRHAVPAFRSVRLWLCGRDDLPPDLREGRCAAPHVGRGHGDRLHGGLDRNGIGELSGRIFLRHHGGLSAVLCERRNRRDPEPAGRCGAVLVPAP
jgi:MFS family permease